MLEKGRQNWREVFGKRDRITQKDHSIFCKSISPGQAEILRMTNGVMGQGWLFKIGNLFCGQFNRQGPGDFFKMLGVSGPNDEGSHRFLSQQPFQ